MRLHDYLAYHAREQPDADFSLFRGERLSYGEALARAQRFSRALAAAGLAPGDRIAVLMRNRPEFALLYFACGAAGVVPVPLNARLAPPEWEFILQDSGARLILSAPEFQPAIDAMRGQLPSLETFVAMGEPARGWLGFEVWLREQPATALERAIDEDADLYQMYTSGTTGRPKGAVLTHRAVTAHLTQVAPVMRITPGERTLVVAPLYHAAGGISTFNTIAQGGCVVIQEEFDPSAVVRALDEEVVAAVLVPAIIQACLLRAPDVRQRRYDNLRLIYYGASPIAAATLRDAMETFGCDFAQAYGMTEMTAGSTNLSPADHRAALGQRPELLVSAGRPLLGVEMRVVDEEDRPLPPGTMGEIVMRGPQLMRGYWRRPEETATALHGGWLHTGDIGRIEADGYLYIMDRVKDMIVSGGENVYPRAIEEVLMRHPAVAEVAVIGVPDAQWGETVKALVVRREGVAAEPGELIDFCRGELAGFERPRSLEFIEALPRTASGKVLKRELREPYWAGQERRVAGS